MVGKEKPLSKVNKSEPLVVNTCSVIQVKQESLLSPTVSDRSTSSVSPNYFSEKAIKYEDDSNGENTSNNDRPDRWVSLVISYIIILYPPRHSAQTQISEPFCLRSERNENIRRLQNVIFSKRMKFAIVGRNTAPILNRLNNSYLTTINELCGCVFFSSMKYLSSYTSTHSMILAEIFFIWS